MTARYLSCAMGGGLLGGSIAGFPGEVVGFFCGLVIAFFAERESAHLRNQK